MYGGLVILKCCNMRFFYNLEFPEMVAAIIYRTLLDPCILIDDKKWD